MYQKYKKYRICDAQFECLHLVLVANDPFDPFGGGGGGGSRVPDLTSPDMVWILKIPHNKKYNYFIIFTLFKQIFLCNFY